MRQEQKGKIVKLEKDIANLAKVKSKTMEESEANSRELFRLQNSQGEVEDKFGDIERIVSRSY